MVGLYCLLWGFGFRFVFLLGVFEGGILFVHLFTDGGIMRNDFWGISVTKNKICVMIFGYS